MEREFYERDTLTVARDLLGRAIVHETVEGATVGIIVETEAYKGPEDKASHAYANLRTGRTEVQFGPKGHAYVYMIYGMYYCLNVTSGEAAGKPEAILVRALEPVDGIKIMARRRKPVSEARLTNLTNGPGKLCMAMGISTQQNGADMCASPLYIDTGVPVDKARIAQTARINVDYADEWRDLRWRFIIEDSPFVSMRLRVS